MNNIVVVLPNWYGETLFATPFLRALHQQLPSARITAMGWPSCREVLLHNPHVHAFLEYQEREGCFDLRSTWQMVRRLRAATCDAAFILRRSLTRSLLVALAGIPMRIGFANPKSGWLLTCRVSPGSSPQHKAATYLPLLTAVGAHATDLTCDYVVSEAERHEARERLRAAGALDGQRPLVILHPGANWLHKRWALERFAALGDRVAESHRAHVLITGGAHDVELADAVRQHMRQSAVVLAGHTTFRQLGACLDQSHLVVSNDTGVLHIAAALHTPLVALYGPTSPALTGPLGDPSHIRIIHHPDCCPQVPCYQPERPPHAGMSAITVEEVYNVAVQLLRTHGSVT